jgi:hypothetical protein
VSIQDIRPDRQDTSNFYLANIYQAVADQNRSHIFISLRVQLWKIYFIQVRYCVYTRRLPISLLVSTTATPSASPGLSSTTIRGASENDGIPSTGLREAKDALRPPTVNPAMRTNAMDTLDPQSPSLPSVTDSDRDIAGSSLREPNAGRTRGDHPPHVSHCSYDIV